MPMRVLNTDPTFVSMMINLQMEWVILAKECGLKNVASKVIADDVFLYGHIENSPGCPEKSLSYTKTEKVKMVSRQAQVCRNVCVRRWNTIFIVQK